jgi:hypothetical protein
MRARKRQQLMIACCVLVLLVLVLSPLSHPDLSTSDTSDDNKHPVTLRSLLNEPGSHRFDLLLPDYVQRSLIPTVGPLTLAIQLQSISSWRTHLAAPISALK